MNESEDRVYRRLRLFNAAMGTLHLLQGLAIMLLSSSETSFSMPAALVAFLTTFHSPTAL